MTKEQILQVTGLSEDEFYQQYPDQETFCNDYPEVCSQIEQNNYFDSVDYKAQNGIETSKPYTNFDDYKKAMQIHDVESAKARTYNNFQNDLYSYANQNPSLFETTTSLGNLFNTLSPQQQDALAQKYNAEFITDALSVNRKKYINSMEMNIPGKGMGYYSFPTNDVVYGTQELKRPNYEFPRLTVNTPDINRNKTFQPFKVLAPIVNNYNLPKELIKNNLQTVPLKDYKELQVLQHKMTPVQTMRKVGSIGTSYTTPLNKYYSIVDLLKSQGKDSSFGERKKLAQMAGINNYTGSAAQNMQLIDYASKMKQGGQPCYKCGGMYEKGGTAIFPAMRTMFKKGGYYGMDGKFHRNTDSGTYVPGGGYYFQDGSTVTSSTPPTSGSPVNISQTDSSYYGLNPDNSFRINTEEKYTFDKDPKEYKNFGSDGIDDEYDLYETPNLGGLNIAENQEQQNFEPFDASQYSSVIDPNTGFTTYSKNNKVLTNIKKQDPQLWEQLKEEGKGARFRTGQTDIQKFGRTAGKIAGTMQAGIDLAGTVGNVLSERNRRRDMNAAAINMGSTAGTYTNPQGSSKGDYGVTGSTYGAFKPYNVGTFSYKGMYGKYGMEVPSYQVGGGFSNLFASPQLAAPISSPVELMPNIPFTQLAAPIVDNTAVYRTNQKVNNTSYNIPSGTLNVDAALQAVAGVESSSKPGETKVGMGTKLVGEGGKKASASGTYQITTSTLQDIYNNDKSISSKYDTFKQFKSAFDKDAKVEYEAARSLMTRHIQDYGVFALGAWYYPEFARRAAKGDKSVFDIIPRRDFGNSVKWGDDFNKKLNAYNKLAGTNYTPNTTFNIQTSTTPTNANFSLKNLMNFAKTNDWNVTSTTGGDHNVGSKHGKGRAIDVSVKNKTPQQIADFMKLAQSQGYRVLDERVRPKGQKKWYGPHLHLDFKTGGQLGGQVVEMDEDEIKQFLAAGGQLEFID
jgi:hypothetical protein